MVLLPDDPDDEMRAALAGLRHLPQLPSASAAGAPARFNDLCAITDEPLVLLLDSGCLPSPTWLDRLVAGLDADPRNGLAGPSTNRSWNPQQVFPHSTGGPAMLASLARDAVQRFDAEARALEPLHSPGWSSTSRCPTAAAPKSSTPVAS